MMSLKCSINRIKKKEMINLSLFSLGKFVSLFGTAIYTFAISLYVLNKTGSGLSFATNLVLGMLPVILISPVAGVLADYFKRKNLVVLMDILSGVLLIGVYYLSSTKGLDLIMIYGTTLVLTIFSTIFGTSLEAGKPNIVSKEKLMTINSISKIIDSTSSILGPMIGGIVYTIMDIEFFILLNGISFILSGISEMFIDFDFVPQEKREQKKINFNEDIKEGFQYLKTQKNLMPIILLFIVINFFISLSIIVPLPFIINNILELDSSYFGIIQSMFPIGMILGSLLVKKVSEKLSYHNLLLKMCFILSICIILIDGPLLLNINVTDKIFLIYYSTIAGIFGVTIALIDIPIMYILQSSITDVYRGRVMSLVMCFVKIVAPIALLISGLFMNSLAPWILPMSGGLLLLAFSLVMNRENVLKNRNNNCNENKPLSEKEINEV